MEKPLFNIIVVVVVVVLVFGVGFYSGSSDKVTGYGFFDKIFKMVGISKGPVCGNGIWPQGSEECDDGNLVNGDGCTSTCQLELPPACGNGVCSSPYENTPDSPNYCPTDCETTKKVARYVPPNATTRVARYVNPNVTLARYVGTGTSSECPLPENLVGWWPANGDARDVVNGNGGLLVDDASFGPGRHGEAFLVSEGYSQIEISDPGNSILDLDNGFTVMGWIYFSETGGWLIRKGNNYKIELSARPRLRAGGGIVSAPWGYEIPLNEWVHVAGTMDSTHTVMKIYVNGNPLEGNTYTSPQVIDQNNEPVVIGDLLHGSGRVDDVMIFNTELSASQIEALMDERCVPPLPPPPTSCIEAPAGLVSWWPGDGNTDDIIGENNGNLIREMGFAEGLVTESFLSTDSGGAYPTRVEVPYSTSLDLRDQFTVMAWVNLGETGGEVVRRGNNYHLGDIAGFPEFRIVGSPGGWQLARTPYQYNFPLNEWVHMAGVYTDDSIKLYINGALAGVNHLSSPMNIEEGDWPLRIANNVNGKVDEVMIYNRALTNDEIDAVVWAGNYGVCK